MYHPPVAPTVLGVALAGGSLAATGLSLLWWLVAAFTLIVAGISLLHLIPKRER